MNVIELTEIRKGFKRVPVLDSVDLQVPQGSAIGISGSNGSGKSVIFKIICGFVKPDSGTVKISKRYLPSGRRYPENFGILIDRPGFLANLTGFENLSMLARINSKISNKEILEWCERFQLSRHLHQRAGAYSLGTKQKLGLVQAFMEDPEVLLLDEPFNALDDSSIESVREAIVNAKVGGKVVLFTSHQVSDMEMLADVRYRLSNGVLRRAD